MVEHRKIWDCYPWELGEPYAAFSSWLHLGPDRPTPEVYAALQGDARIAPWATAGLWQQRAAHYDRSVATREVVLRIPLFAGIAPRLLGLIEGRLRDLEAQAAAGVTEVVSTREMIQLSRLLLLLQKEAREAGGSGAGLPATPESSLDYGALSVEELREFQAMLAKAATASEAKRVSGPRAESVFLEDRGTFHVKH